VSQQPPLGTLKDGLLYLPNTKAELDVRCEPTPALHSVPVFSDGTVELVATPPVTVNININKK